MKYVSRYLSEVKWPSNNANNKHGISKRANVISMDRSNNQTIETDKFMPRNTSDSSKESSKMIKN